MNLINQDNLAFLCFAKLIFGINQDETPRDTSLEKMAELDFLFGCDKVTAAVSSQTCDAASAMLLVSADALNRYQLTPRIRADSRRARKPDGSPASHPSTIRSLSVLSNGDLVAGGSFTSIGGQLINRIASWDGSPMIGSGPPP